MDLLRLRLAFQPLSDEQDVDGGDDGVLGEGLDDDENPDAEDGDEDFEAAGFSVEEDGDEAES